MVVVGSTALNLETSECSEEEGRIIYFCSIVCLIQEAIYKTQAISETS